MKILAVGSQYPLNEKLFPNAVVIHLSDGDYDFASCLTKPTKEEVELVQKGKGRFWLIYENGLIIIQFRFSDEKSNKIEGEFPFHIGLYDKAKAKCSIENLEEDKHYLFSFSLVEHESNIIKSLRAFTLGPKFLAKFRLLIERQRAENPDPTDYQNEYRRIASMFSFKKLNEKAVCYANIGSDLRGGDL